MADFAGTVSLKAGPIPAFGGHPGMFAFQIALSSTLYVGGTLNLSSIANKLHGIDPADIAHMLFEVGATPGYIINWTPAATPTWANFGTLKLFVASGGVATATSTLPAALTEGDFATTELTLAQKINAILTALGSGTVVKSVTAAALAEASGSLTLTLRGAAILGRLKA